MASVDNDSDDGMDEFMDKFKTQRYKNAFTENTWEEVMLTFRNQLLPLFEGMLFNLTATFLLPSELKLIGVGGLTCSFRTDSSVLILTRSSIKYQCS